MQPRSERNHYPRAECEHHSISAIRQRLHRRDCPREDSAIVFFVSLTVIEAKEPRRARPYSAPMCSPFSATERFISKTRTTSASASTAHSQKTSK